MKKKFLSLICGLAMVTTMLSSFVVANAADAPVFKIETDATDTTSIKAGDTFNVSVVLDGLEGLQKYNSKTKTGTGVSSAQFVLFMPDNEFITSGSETVASGAVANWIETEGGWNLSVAFSGAAGAMISQVPYTLATVDFTANKDLTEEQIFKILDTEVAAVTKQVVTSGTITETTKFELSNSTLSAPSLVLGAGETKPVVTSIDIAGADTVEAEATATYTATVKDADGAEMADETVTWSIKEDTAAATIDAATGVLTAGKPDADTTVTVVATSATKADVSAEKTVTISKYVPPVVDPTIELTAEEGKDSAAGAYTFFYKAVITAGTEAITAADVTITSGKNSRRAFLSADMLANIGGGITFYVGNKTADAGRTFSAVGTVNDIASDAVDYTTPAE